MRSDVAQRYATWLVDHSTLVVLVVLALTAAMAVGAVVGENEDAGIGEFETGSEAEDAQTYVEEHYETDDRVVAQLVVRDEGGDALTRESLLESLELQRAVREDETLNATLSEEGFVGLENVVGTAAVFEDRANEADGSAAGTNGAAAGANGPPDTGRPTLDEQIEALEGRSDGEVEDLLERILDPETETDFGAGADRAGDPYEFLPRDYEPGSATADARITFLFQVDDGGADDDPQAAYDAQVEIQSLFDERFDDGFVFGQGITDAASSNAVGDSFAIITPVAFVLVVAVLAATYRDVVDVLLAFAGIAVVMVWLAGLLGWLEIPTSQLLIAVPFLLIGLSIDYALHVVMRYREARAGTLDRTGGESVTGPGGTAGGAGEVGEGTSDGGDADVTMNDDADEVDAMANDDADEAAVRRGVRRGMTLGLSGVVLALAAATVSTGVGFLSNVVSPLSAIQDFALLSAGGILATFVAFAVFVPALKVAVDGSLEERFGRDRAKAPFGVTAGPINRALSAGATLARTAPLAVVVVALVLAAGGAYGATTIDTEFNQADFLPRDSPDWAKSLPGPLATGTYTVADDAAYLGENFQGRGEGTQAEVLIRDGDVTDPAFLRAVEDARADVDGDGTITVASDGSAAVEGPLSVLEDAASDDEDLAEAIDERDTTGDGVPDEDLAGLYDLLFEVDEEAASGVLERSGAGEYESARLTVSVRGDAAAQDVAEDVRAFAADVESGASVAATATGGPVTTAAIQDALLETLVQAFAVTLVVILAFLALLFWALHRTPSLGVITLAPVVAALAWLLGTMALLDVPFNSETAVITSLAIGLGVDYSIHLGERFVAERERTDDLDEALTATMAGTGGALLASAATTAAGFGVLALSLSPPIRRFGLVTGASIVLAFVACLTVLPSLLVLWDRYR